MMRYFQDGIYHNMNNENEYVPTENEAQEHIELIILWLMHYGNLEKPEAITKLIQANIIFDKSNQLSLMFFHEEPYYWAMEIIFGFGSMWWHKDKNLWPPLTDYEILVEKYYAGETD
ncbi:MAG TPA: hypothetical protein VLL52_04720 [Anaerolineae bacterium]|nr:hypothetical protein [Anaerolineae bacterium]